MLNDPNFYLVSFLIPAVASRILVTYVLLTKVGVWFIRYSCKLFIRSHHLEGSRSLLKASKVALAFVDKYSPTWYKVFVFIQRVIAVFCSILLCFEALYIIRLRDAMRVIGGDAWIEGQVGFGQVLAILLWMPVLAIFLSTLIYEYFITWLNAMKQLYARIKLDKSTKRLIGIELKDPPRAKKVRAKTF